MELTRYGTPYFTVHTKWTGSTKEFNSHVLAVTWSSGTVRNSWNSVPGTRCNIMVSFKNQFAWGNDRTRRTLSDRCRHYVLNFSMLINKTAQCILLISTLSHTGMEHVVVCKTSKKVRTVGRSMNQRGREKLLRWPSDSKSYLGVLSDSPHSIYHQHG